MVIKQLQWVEVSKKNDESRVTNWLGKINGRLIFSISQFKNEMFTDPYIMTSGVLPMEMKKDEDLDELKETAQILLEAFINSFKADEHGN